MSETYYHPQTLKNLANVLYGNNLSPLYSGILVHTVQDAIIPWNKREEVIPESELEQCVRDYVILSFQPYDGSPHGYQSHVSDRWYVYASLWGRRAANMLVLDDFTGRAVAWDGDTTITISDAKRTDRNIFYTDRIVKWLRDVMPKCLLTLTDDTLVDYISEAYVQYGAFGMSLPDPQMPTEQERVVIEKFAAELFDFTTAPGMFDKYKSVVTVSGVPDNTYSVKDVNRVLCS